MAVDRELGAGSWSYFGDPRAISHDGHTFTGWISTSGNVWVARYTAGGRLSKRLIFKGLGRDDHNNPSLVFRHDGHIMVFFSPHSGHHLPPPGIPSVMRYMVSLNPYSINGFGKVHQVATNVPGGLGYTYPNPVLLQDKLWLFWRGGGWNPTFSYTEDGLHGCRRASSSTSATGSGRTRSTSATATAGSTSSAPMGTPRTGRTACTTRATRPGALFAMSGARLGTLADVPLHTSKLDHIYTYSDRGGRAWGHDIALTAEGRPRVVYTRRVANRDTFYYAYHNGTKWISRKIVEAGVGRPRFTPAGRRSTTRTRASSTCRARSAAGTRSSSGSRPTTAARGHAAAHERPLGLHIRPVTPRGLRGRQPDPLRAGATSARSGSPTTRPASTRWTSSHPAGAIRPVS